VSFASVRVSLTVITKQPTGGACALCSPPTTKEVKGKGGKGDATHILLPLGRPIQDDRDRRGSGLLHDNVHQEASIRSNVVLLSQIDVRATAQNPCLKERHWRARLYHRPFDRNRNSSALAAGDSGCARTVARSRADARRTAGVNDLQSTSPAGEEVRRVLQFRPMCFESRGAVTPDCDLSGWESHLRV